MANQAEAAIETVRAHRAFLMTVDPLHVGSGGYRLGRVDLPIVREPGTNLPKVPGTSLSGAARAYAALLKNEGKGGAVQCAGQREHCAKCAVCAAFGSMRRKAAKEEGKPDDLALAGMVNIFDARLVLFPIFSMAGPIWTTTHSIFSDAGFSLSGAEPTANTAWITRPWPTGRINLGWVLLETKPTEPVLTAPHGVDSKHWDAIKDRIVVLPDWLFPHIVNMNLEVRTSVSIDPRTGAAKDGALFTYEAIPRGAWLELELGEHRYRDFPATKRWASPLQVVWDGLAMAERLGVGGMGTRGFGRVRLLGTRPNGGAA